MMLEAIAKRLADYDKRGAQLFSDTVDELCACGVAKGCFQDYGVLTDVLEILAIVERYLNEEKGV